MRVELIRCEVFKLISGACPPRNAGTHIILSADMLKYEPCVQLYKEIQDTESLSQACNGTHN